MASVSGVSTISKVFSKLGDNTGSVIPMYVKDFTSDTITSLTYFKNGGNRDGAEKTLEEFGTGVIWIGGIPFLKKFLFDNFIFKKFKMNPDIDAKRLFSGKKGDSVNTIEFARDTVSSLGSKFSEQKNIMDYAIENKDFAKKLALSKFAFSTAITGLAMFGIITLKQKLTEKELKKQIKEKQYESVLLNHKTEQNQNGAFDDFLNKNKKIKQPNFKGLGTFFMTNPIANTAIVDCVITSTRLTQARKGERFEVGLKEAWEIIFVYGLAQPLQKSLEFIFKKLFNKSIKLDYSVLDSDVIKQAVQSENIKKGSSELLKQAKQIISLTGNDSKITDENAKNVIKYIFDNSDNAMAEVLKRTGDIGTFKTKEGVEQLSILSSINVGNVKDTALHTIELVENAAKSNNFTKYLKNTKFLKGLAIIGNIAISSLLIGYIQPKINLYLRKKRNNGDNTNPAIKNLENEISKEIAFESAGKKIFANK